MKQIKFYNVIYASDLLNTNNVSNGAQKNRKHIEFSTDN